MWFPPSRAARDHIGSGQRPCREGDGQGPTGRIGETSVIINAVQEQAERHLDLAIALGPDHSDKIVLVTCAVAADQHVLPYADIGQPTIVANTHHLNGVALADSEDGISRHIEIVDLRRKRTAVDADEFSAGEAHALDAAIASHDQIPVAEGDGLAIRTVRQICDQPRGFDVAHIPERETVAVFGRHGHQTVSQIRCCVSPAARITPVVKYAHIALPKSLPRGGKPPARMRALRAGDTFTSQRGAHPRS